MPLPCQMPNLCHANCIPCQQKQITHMDLVPLPANQRADMAPLASKPRTQTRCPLPLHVGTTACVCLSTRWRHVLCLSECTLAGRNHEMKPARFFLPFDFFALFVVGLWRCSLLPSLVCSSRKKAKAETNGCCALNCAVLAPSGAGSKRTFFSDNSASVTPGLLSRC